MVFSSVTFIFIFLPIVILLNKIIQNTSWKNSLLLVASLIFYAWGEPIYILLLIFSSLVNYVLAFFLQENFSSEKNNREKVVLILAIVFNLMLLGVFKYTGFLLTSINDIFNSNFSIPKISLPIGISFYTFQTMSYMIDVYRSEVKVQKNYFNLLLYISFFPQLVAGPIVKYHDIDQQIIHRKESWAKTQLGLRRVTIGLAKKILIANQMAYIVDQIYDNAAWGFASSWLFALAYMLQIYFDFSGYSDMAIGFGLIFGFKFKRNFNYPYESKSVREFWQRWHISLSTWFKEYLYFPLGGSRVPTWRVIFNNFLVFFCTGLWHGASWNFVIWGLWQWVFMMLERYILHQDKWYKPIRHIYTILNVMLSFVIFRTENMVEAFNVFAHMFIPGLSKNASSLALLNRLMTPLSIILLIIGVLVSTSTPKNLVKKSPKVVRNGIYLSLWILSIMFLASATYNPFIYFRF